VSALSALRVPHQRLGATTTLCGFSTRSLRFSASRSSQANTHRRFENGRQPTSREEVERDRKRELARERSRRYHRHQSEPLVPCGMLGALTC